MMEGDKSNEMEEIKAMSKEMKLSPSNVQRDGRSASNVQGDGMSASNILQGDGRSPSIFLEIGNG